MINTAYCTLILLGKFIQRLVFAELRVSEQQHLKDKFWNFVFYKFIFVFGVINVQYMDEVIMWCAWFTVLGSLHLLAQLSKDRFEYVSTANKALFITLIFVKVSLNDKWFIVNIFILSLIYFVAHYFPVRICFKNININIILLGMFLFTYNYFKIYINWNQQKSNHN